MEELTTYIKKFKNDPKHWTNNKRRLRGYCALRKGANNKKRFQPDWKTIYDITYSTLEDRISEKISQEFDKFMDIKDL